MRSFVRKGVTLQNLSPSTQMSWRKHRPVSLKTMYPNSKQPVYSWPKRGPFSGNCSQSHAAVVSTQIQTGVIMKTQGRPGIVPCVFSEGTRWHRLPLQLKLSRRGTRRLLSPGRPLLSLGNLALRANKQPAISGTPIRCSLGWHRDYSACSREHDLSCRETVMSAGRFVCNLSSGA